MPTDTGPTMDLRIFTEPQQGASYDTLLAVAQATEQLGFSAFFRSDHYLAMGSASGLPGPTDAWVTLAGLARETSSIRLGTLVSPVTFRLPGPLAISVAQVDAMSGGRVELGLGAGWFEREHAAYGIPYPTEVRDRVALLEEQVEVVVGLWTTPEGETYDHRGATYTLEGSPALPKPVQRPHPPIVLGGAARPRAAALAARFAAEYNAAFTTVDEAAARFARVRAACEAAGRAVGSIVTSHAAVLCCGHDDAEVARRAAVIGRSVDDLRTSGALVGTPAELVDQLGRWHEAGSTRAYLQVLDLEDVDHLALVAAEVLPAVS